MKIMQERSGKGVSGMVLIRPEVLTGWRGAQQLQLVQNLSTSFLASSLDLP